MITLLDRRRGSIHSADYSSKLNSTQREMDETLNHFSEEACDWKNLLAMTTGSFAYRLGKIGAYSLGSSKYLSPLFGLASEVTVYRGVTSLLNSFRPPLHSSASSWFNDFVNFGTLKFFGKISQNQNLFLQHFIQDSGMVAAQHLAYTLQLSPAIQGTLSEQFLHAEIMNLQMNAGMALFHGISQGKILHAEKSLEIFIETKMNPANFSNSLTPQTLSMYTGSGEKGPNTTPYPPPPVIQKEAPIPELPRAQVFVGETMDTQGPTEVRPRIALGEASVLAETRLPETPSAAFLNPSGPLNKGTRVGPDGRYILMNHLGSGGFGDVYKVYDERLARLAVIKVPRHANTGGNLMQRFDREITIGANLDPRYTVAVYDRFELGNNIPVPVMEYVSGNDLSRILLKLRSQNLPADQFDYERRLAIFAEICEAMESAHRKGIMHRDLKPENIRLDEEGHVRIMDWGIAKPFAEANPDSSVSSTEPIILDGEPLTQHGSWTGTLGYVAPEIMRNQPIKNPRSPDIFALGVILYEWIAAVHPFGAFQEGQSEKGEAKKIPVYDDHGHPKLSLLASILGPHSAPTFEEVMIGNAPAYIREIEPIARKAFSENPENRYQSIQELREAVLLAFARSEQNQIQESLRVMDVIEAQMQEAWDRFQIGQQMQAEQWQAMHQPISTLREMRSDWRQKALDLIKYLETTFHGRTPQEAKKMIAELAWRLLIDEGDTISHRERQSLEKLIRQNDVATAEDASPSMKDALNGNLSIHLSVLDRMSRNEGFPQMTRVRLFKYFPDKDAHGNSLLTYRPQLIFDKSLRALRDQSESPGIAVNEGYYVFEITHAGYHTTRIPLHVTLEDIRLSLQKSEALQIEAELVGSRDFPHNMVFIQGGTAYTGLDIYDDPNPLEKHSPPLRKISYTSFAITRDPITVAQYHAFVESVLDEINTALRKRNYTEAATLLNKARNYIPRGQLHLDPMASLTENPNPEKLAEAFSGVKYNWRVQASQEGSVLQFKLQDPVSHLSAAQEPILAEQPIHAIPLTAIRAYVDWKNKTEGRSKEKGLYRIPERVELEIIARNTFPWTYPWGYLFNPNFLESRLTHADVDRGSYARAVGTHSRGSGFYRDRSAFDVYDLLGNTRKITQTPAEPGCVYCFGGSVRTPFGPYFLPSALLYAGANTVNEYNSSFYLVLDLPEAGSN